MTIDPNSATPPQAPTPNETSGGCGYRRGRRGGRKALMIVAILGSFFAGGVLFSHIHAFSEEGPAWMQQGERMHHMGWMDSHGPQPGDHGPPMSPEQRMVHMRGMLDHALTGVDATQDQKTKILAIFDTALTQLKGAPVVVFQTRLALATVLTAPTVDHDKLEALRATRVSDADNASKIIVKAVADAGDVLSQDQRTRLLMMMHEHGMHPETMHEDMMQHPPMPQ